MSEAVVDVTDGRTDRDISSAAPAGRSRVTVNRVLGAGLALVVLAAVGATGGYLLAGDGTGGESTALPSATSTPAAPSRSAAPTTPRTSTAAPARSSAAAGGMILPDLVGEDFERAREELRERKLGWRLVFGTGEDRSVTRTVPSPGSTVRRGVTVQLHVSGAAPVEEVPDVVGESCGEAANEIVDEGFFPRYRTGRTGQVVAQDPPEGSERQWNDEVSISCGSAPPTMLTPSPNP